MAEFTKRELKKNSLERRQGRTWKIVVFPILLIWSLTLLYPLIWALLNTFKHPQDFNNNSFGLPAAAYGWQPQNWAKAFTAMTIPLSSGGTANLFDMIGNSLWWMVGNVLLSHMVTIGMAYALAKYKYRIGKVLYTVNLIIMTIPIVGAFPAQYGLYKKLGLVNSPLLLVTAMGCLGGANLMLYYSYFKNISWTYAEAVFVDGGGHWTVFLRIMIPQAMPIISALVILSCISSWNDYFTPLVYLGDFPTLATGLFRLQSGSGGRNKPVYFAAVLWSVLPMLLLFSIFSNKIMTSVSMGGIKG